MECKIKVAVKALSVRRKQHKTPLIYLKFQFSARIMKEQNRRETLKKQGQVAKEADNPTMDANFQRAAELVNVPDDIILDMYNKLRPNRSTKKELILMAQELLQKYNAPHCAKLVLEAAEIYEKRGILR